MTSLQSTFAVINETLEELPEPPPRPLFRSNARHLSRKPRPQNLYMSDGTARIWYQLRHDEGPLELEPCYDPDYFEGVGTRPQWITEEIDANGMDFFSSHSSWNHGYEAWALRTGLAPRQWFAVQHDKPRYSGGGYYDDWDVDYDWELVEIQHLARHHAASRWESYFRQKSQWELAKMLEQQRVQQIRSANTTYMYIKWDRYDSSGICSPHGRQGVQVSLFSTYDHYSRFNHRGHAQLARGVSKTGDKSEAWADLVESVQERAPTVVSKLKMIDEKSMKGWRRFQR